MKRNIMKRKKGLSFKSQTQTEREGVLEKK